MADLGTAGRVRVCASWDGGSWPPAPHSTAAPRRDTLAAAVAESAVRNQRPPKRNPVTPLIVKARRDLLSTSPRGGWRVRLHGGAAPYASATGPYSVTRPAAHQSH